MAYVGFPLSGKSSCLRSVLKSLRAPYQEYASLHEGPIEATAPALDADVEFLICARRSCAWNHERTLPDEVLRRELSFLRSADAIAFVVDSQRAIVAQSETELDSLRCDLESLGRRLDDIPVAFHANKRDLPDILSMDEIRARFRSSRSAYLETAATAGVGPAQGLGLLLGMLEPE